MNKMLSPDALHRKKKAAPIYDEDGGFEEGAMDIDMFELEGEDDKRKKKKGDGLKIKDDEEITDEDFNDGDDLDDDDRME